MKDYSKFIEEQLNTLMPFSEIYEENKPIEYPVKDAPKVSGYFGFIGLKYMKRVRNIKKLCVEYINTYVEGSLNVANKIDKVDLIKNYKNLATEVGFKVSQGFSTQGTTQTSDNKEGVAFLTGDKAVMDKLNSIKSQIKTYASKSASLTEWASLMIDKSHMVACQIVKEKTDEMIDDKKEKENAQKEFDKKLAEANKQLEEEKKKTEELNKKFEKYGDYSQMNHDMYNLKDIADIAQTDYNNDMSLPLDDKKSKIYVIRRKFYTDPKSKWGLNDFSKYNEDIDKVLTSDVVTKKLEGISNEEQKEQAKNEVKNYALSVLLAKDADVKNKNQYLSPIDLQILRNNISAIGKATIEGSNRASEKMGSYRATPVFKVSKFKGDELNKIDVLNMDRNLLATIAGEWGYTFGECTMYQDKEEKTNEGSLYEIEIKNQINETKHYVMGWDEFLNEHLSKMSDNFEVNMDGVNIQDKCIANGDGIYAYYSDTLSRDANLVFVVKNGKAVLPSDRCLKELNVDEKWGLYGSEFVLYTYNDSAYYGTVGFKHGMEILKKYYPRLKTYYCNVGYHTFSNKWTKTDKDSVYAKVCDEIINII